MSQNEPKQTKKRPKVNPNHPKQAKTSPDRPKMSQNNSLHKTMQRLKMR